MIGRIFVELLPAHILACLKYNLDNFHFSEDPKSCFMALGIEESCLSAPHLPYYQISLPIDLNQIDHRLRLYRDQHILPDFLNLAFGLKFYPKQGLLKLMRSQIHLTEKEVLLLLHLQQAGSAGLNKDQLLAHVWNYENIETHTLETHIYRLRQKLHLLGRGDLIQHISQGYALKTRI